MFEFDLFLAVLKVLVAIGTCVVGVFALLGDYRDSSGSINNHGRRTLYWMVALAVTAIVIAIIENQKAVTDSKEQLARSENLMREISRSVQPLRKMAISFQFEIPDDGAMVSDYIRKLDLGVRKNSRELQNNLLKGKGASFSVGTFGLGGEPLTVTIERQGRYWPKGDSSDIGLLVDNLRPSLLFYRIPMAPKDFNLVRGATVNSPDLDLVSLSTRNASLEYHPKDRKLIVSGSYDFDQLSLISGTGRVSSVPDLFGAQLIIQLMMMDVPASQPAFARYARPKLLLLKKTAILRYAVFSFGDGRELWLDAKAFVKDDRATYRTYSLTLPKSDDGLRKMSSSTLGVD